MGTLQYVPHGKQAQGWPASALSPLMLSDQFGVLLLLLLLLLSGEENHRQCGSVEAARHGGTRKRVTKIRRRRQVAEGGQLNELERRALATATQRTRVAALSSKAAAACGDSDFETAVRLYQRALRILPAEPLLTQRLGEALSLCNGRVHEAESELRAAIALEPRNSLAFRSLALLLREVGRGAEANSYAHTAKALGREHQMQMAALHAARG
eukprot:COSAG01_NODE_12799_length_1683_cov_2.226641_2_plen_211_part_01